MNEIARNTARDRQRINGLELRARDAARAQVHVGRSALRALTTGRGSVFAAFASALYLESAAGMACLVPPWAPRGPLNVNLHGFESGAQRLDGATWQADGATLAINGLGTFALSPRDEWAPARLPSASPAALLAGVASMRAALAARAIRGEVLVHALASLHEHPSVPVTGTAAPPDFIDARFARTVPTLSRWLDDALAGRDASTPWPVADLLGAGHGLTPSGDDCIVGVLVALHALGECDVAASVAHIVTRHAPRRTSRLSAAHLDAACAGEAIEPVHATIEAIAANTAPEPSLDALERYGHGSGFDALAGVLLAAGAIAHNRASASHCRRSGSGDTDGWQTPTHSE